MLTFDISDTSCLAPSFFLHPTWSHHVPWIPPLNLCVLYTICSQSQFLGLASVSTSLYSLPGWRCPFKWPPSHLYTFSISTTAGPHITLFCSTIIERKLNSGRGRCLCGVGTFSHVCVGFLRICGFLPRPKTVHVRWIGVFVWVIVGGREWPCDARVSCPSASCLVPWIAGTSFGHCDPELESAGWKRMILFLFIFLKCIYSSYLFQCLLSEMFWVFI